MSRTFLSLSVLLVASASAAFAQPSRDPFQEALPPAHARTQGAGQLTTPAPLPPPPVYRLGDLSGLNGCWRMSGPWTDVTGYREFCFLGRTGVSYSMDLRWTNGTLNRCTPWPGARLLEPESNEIVIELPQTTGNACADQSGPINYARQQYRCSLDLQGSPALVCNRAAWRFNSEEIFSNNSRWRFALVR